MSDKKSTGLRVAARVALLFAALFAAAFLTRLPAVYLAGAYALHGVLAAPFFGAIAAVNVRKGGAGWEFAAALAALAFVLGAMSPVMGLGFAVVAVAYALAWRALKAFAASARVTVCGAVVGLACYIAPVCIGAACGSYLVSAGSALQLLLLAASATASGALGAYVCKE